MMDGRARLVCLVASVLVGCGGDPMRRPAGDGAVDAAGDSGVGDGEAGDGSADGATPDADAAASDAESADAGDGSIADAGSADGMAADTGMPLDTSPTRFTLPFTPYDFDVDSSGRFAVAGRQRIGTTTNVGLTCGEPLRTVTLGTENPTGAMVRRSRTSGRTYIAIEVFGAASLRAWVMESTNGDCDRPLLPAHTFDAAWVSGSFQAEVVHDLDVTDAGLAWVLTSYGDEVRLTRFDGVARGESRGVSCFPSFGPDAVRMALDPATGAGAVACASSLSGIEIRRFDASGWMGTGFVALAGTDSIFPQTLEMSIDDAGVVALSWRGWGMPVTTESRHVTTIDAAGAVNDLDLGASASVGAAGYEDFVRDRRLPADFVLVERAARTLSRYSAVPALAGSGTAPLYVYSSPVRADGYGRAYAFDSIELTRSDFTLP